MNISLKIPVIFTLFFAIVNGQMIFIGDDESSIPNTVYANEDATITVPIRVDNLYQMSDVEGKQPDGDDLTIQIVFDRQSLLINDPSFFRIYI